MDRRPHQRPSWRVREAVGLRRGRQPHDDELARLIESGDTNTATMERMAELLGQNGPKWPPGDERP